MGERFGKECKRGRFKERPAMIEKKDPLVIVKSQGNLSSGGKEGYFKRLAGARREPWIRNQVQLEMNEHQILQ